MYDTTDPRSQLGGTAEKEKKPATDFVGPEYGLFYDMEPQERGPEGTTWYTRGQNFIVAYSETEPGAAFSRADQPDEYMVIVAERDTEITVEANGESQDVPGYSLVIVPPGDSRVTVPSGGRIVRLFSTESQDLAARCSNADSYAEAHPNIPPFEPWPEPVGGYKIRRYSLDVPKEEGRFGRIFRCTTMMVNFLDPQEGPRDITKLSPHHHDDFEQGSLVLDGEYMHHMRWPWTVDMNQWIDDHHTRAGAPSLTVIPPPATHTSRAIAAGNNQLVDIFAPPRLDFSRQKGWVLNADEYPMPEDA